MKKYLFTIAVLFLGISIDAQTKLSADQNKFSKKESVKSEIVITKDQITEDGKSIGKFEVKKKESKTSKNEKTEFFEVEIYDRNGAMVAEYEVTIKINEKSNKATVKDAQMKTLRDRVTHNGANFLDYSIGDESEDSEVPQLKKAIKYLLSYDYL
jgi:hypothetical protein